MQSMTGYGNGEASTETKKITIEIKSVNGKFLDINIKSPRSFLALENEIKSKISEVLKRGSVDVFINIDAEDDKDVDFNESLAKKYMEIAENLNQTKKVKNDITASSLLSLPDVVSTKRKETDAEELANLTEKALKDALKNLSAMREKEGKNLKSCLEKLSQNLKSELDKVSLRTKPMQIEYMEKLKIRVQELLKDSTLDEMKIANELAFFVDKSSIEEEIARLYSHLTQFNQLIISNGAIGKSLDFLCQEMGREINTMGSKSADIEITQHVLKMKNFLEDIKEQSRNVE